MLVCCQPSALKPPLRHVEAKRCKAIERLPKPERIRLAKAKMTKVLDHFLYVIELHANNSFVVFSPLLASQIPRSHAANAFNVFQRSMHQIEIVRLCAIWDSIDLDKENIPTVVALIDDDEIIETLAERRVVIGLAARASGFSTRRTIPLSPQSSGKW